MKLPHLSSLTIFSFFLLSSTPILADSSKGEPNAVEMDAGSAVASDTVNPFVGCVEYSVTYDVLLKEEGEKKTNAEKVAAMNKKLMGDRETVCYNRKGDWVVIHSNAELIDRIWYFTDSNKEYSYFKSGVLKFAKNDVLPSDEAEGQEITRFEKTEEHIEILGINAQEYKVVRSSGMKTSYWASTTLIQNPASYKHNLFSYTNELHANLKGVVLRSEQNISDVFLNSKSAININREEPDPSLFVLPAVTPVNW